MEKFTLFFLLFLARPLTAQLYVAGTLKVSSNSNIYTSESNFINASAANLQIDGQINNRSTNFFVSPGALIAGSGKIAFEGSVQQFVDGNNVLLDCNVEINNSSNVSLVQLLLLPTAISDNTLFLNKSLNFTSGDITTSSNKVLFSASSSYIGASNNSHINGWASKIGNTAFVFPVGNGSLLRQISISAPSNINDRFESCYIHSDPSPTYPDNLLAPSLYTISSCEYWLLNRTVGSASVNVNLTWNSFTSCGVTNPADLRVAKWTGSLWNDLGNGGTTGNNNNGSIVTSSVVNSFSPFTLASISDDNPLPITLIDFDAQYNSDKGIVDLNWQTYSELNNDYFTVEKSRDGSTWNAVIDIPGAGTHNGYLSYYVFDENPYNGLSYYRLKQTDYDGTTTYSDLKSVYVDDILTVYPNPTYDFITVDAPQLFIENVSIVNAVGQQVYLKEFNQEAPNKIEISTEFLVSGLYTIQIHSKDFLVERKIVKL